MNRKRKRIWNHLKAYSTFRTGDYQVNQFKEIPRKGIAKDEGRCTASDHLNQRNLSVHIRWKNREQ